MEEWGIIEERERSGGRMGDNGRKRKEWWENGGIMEERGKSGGRIGDNRRKRKEW